MTKLARFIDWLLDITQEEKNIIEELKVQIDTYEFRVSPKGGLTKKRKYHAKK